MGMRKTRIPFGLLAAAGLSLATGGKALADDFPEPYNTEPEDVAPMPAEEAARTATLPPGFRLELFASEPDVQQPIGICFDDQGRLWVAECYTFAERPLRWDLELRDRIVVLEDTDKDGKADKRTVFWDEGKRLTSIAFGKGGIWASCAPEILFIPDADGDLVPDGDAKVVLDGFDAENIGHNIVNGLKWGPDGWLYGRHGITATSMVGIPDTPQSQRTALNCSIWRYHPDTKAFEVVCNGGTNPWGMDWDSNGQLFYTNTVIGHFWHAIPGAYYTRMFGAHLNPHAYELIPHTADHYHWDTGSEKWSDIREGITSTTDKLGGGHAHMGCLIYQGGVWPKEYHGNMFTCNLHGRRVNMDVLERGGCGYVAHHGKDFLQMEDPWFRGLDLVTGPEGQVWMNDWSDTGECHDNDGIHRTSGRIYRIVYEGPDAGKPTPDRPEWLTDRGRGKTAAPHVGGLAGELHEGKQALAVRWLVEDHPESPETLKTLRQVASEYPSPLVRLELAAALQRLPLESRFSIAEKLVGFSEDAEDRQQPLMIWYGVADAVPEFPDKAISLAVNSKLPTVTRLISRRLCEDLEKVPGPVDTLLLSALSSGKPEVRELVLKGMSEALEGWGTAPQPEGWQGLVEEMDGNSSEEVQALVRELSVLFGDGRAREELLAIAEDAEADPGARRAALHNLLHQPDDDLLPLLEKWVNDKVIGTEAIRGLAKYDGKGISTRVINSWKRYPERRTAAIDTLVSRASHAADLLKQVEQGDIPRDAISPFQARQIHNLGDEGLRKQLQKLWGEIRETPAEKKQEMAKWKSLLTSEAIASGNPEQGMAVFQQSCSACHKLYGQGGALGPDLTGSDRHNIDYLIQNIVNPNDVVPVDYQLTVFTLKDGRVVSGVVPEQNERTVTVQSATEQVVIRRDEMEKQESMPISLMPEGLLKTLPEDSVKDLVAYLMTKGPLKK
jgi:putative membrane-bound dehydrogenase-like protein